MKMVLESNKEGNGGSLPSLETNSSETIKSEDAPNSVNSLLKDSLILVNGFTKPPDSKINNLIICTNNIIRKQISLFSPAESEQFGLRKALIKTKLRGIQTLDYCIKELFVKNHEILNAVKLNEVSKQKFNTSKPVDSTSTNNSQITITTYNISQVTTNVSQVNKPKVTKQALELISYVKTNKTYSELLPPKGDLKRPDLQSQDKVLVKTKDQTNLPVWLNGLVIRMQDEKPDKTYKVRIDYPVPLFKIVPAKHLAYSEPSRILIPVGIRIVAQYKRSDSDDSDDVKMVSGIVAEPPKIINKCRYLIFFDDGCAKYVNCDDVHLVCEQSIDVSKDIDNPKLGEFIRKYLSSYPERPMVKLQPGQNIKVEKDGYWLQCKVIEVDCSMVQIKYLMNEVREWIYRGSQRIGILYDEFNKTRRPNFQTRRHNLFQKKPHQPYIEYTREYDIITLSDSEDESNKSDVKTKPRNTAIKSTGGSRIRSLNVPYFPNMDKDIKSHAGYKKMRELKGYTKAVYKLHTCSKGCKETVSPSLYIGENPLLIPLQLGWERQLRKNTKRRHKITVIYRAPCGRSLRTIKEVFQYLFLVSSELFISFFSFNVNVLVLREFHPKEILYHDKDITKGKEQVPVECVNSLSDESPPYFEYAQARYPGNGVHLNLDPSFLCGCDCTDNCQNFKRCQCRQLTIRANTPNGQSSDKVGYKYGRLKSNLITGIYECNSQCKCSSLCLNRVVQHGLQVRLQMFKTLKKGWGIRCLDDIDAGTFICIYAGQLLTEQGADQDGNEFGDEYLAELDHIEVAEAAKQGYESNVTDIEMEEENRKVYYNKEESNILLSSDSEEIHADSDSDFETPLRTTATSTYATRSKEKEKKSYSTCNSPLLDENSKSSLNGSEDKISLDSFCSNNSKNSSKNLSNHSDSENCRKSKRLKLNNGKVAKKSGSAKQSNKPQRARRKHKFISVRTLFEEKSCYIMDAKSKGNIGRYLNHSCEPNVFVQNVFIDTHDLRFPTVAFFAEKQIDAGTELTWDYNYDVGSVEGKVMYCYCDAEHCRGRLL